MNAVHKDLKASFFLPASHGSGDLWSNYLGEQWLPGEASSEDSKIECTARIVHRKGGCAIATIEAETGYRVTHSARDVRSNTGKEFILYAVTSKGACIKEAGQKGDMRFSEGEILLRDGNNPSVISTAPGFRCVAMRIPVEKVDLGFRRHYSGSAITLPQQVPGFTSLNALLREQETIELSSILDNFRRIERAALELVNLVVSGSGVVDPSHRDTQRMVELLKLVDDRIADPDFRLADIANELHISDRWVRKLFADLGVNFKSYVIERRLLKAQEMLSDPRMTTEKLVVVALECGFSDQAHFTRHFTKRFGQSPGRYREMASRGAVINTPNTTSP